MSISINKFIYIVVLTASVLVYIIQLCTSRTNTVGRRNQMIRIDASGVKPIYEQIYDEFVKLILLDVLKEGDNLPSVRELALTLQINPNTIQKSYKLLESKKFIKSIKGKGNFVDSKNEAYDYYKNDLEKKLTVIVEEMMQIGIEKEVILILVEEMVNNA